MVSIFTTNKNFVDQYHPKSLFIRSPLDFKEFKKDIISLEPHFIINAVGMNGVSECESNKKHAWELNTIVSENIAKAAKITNSTVILISTDRVFNGQKGPYTETDRPDPVSYFGKSKLAAENIVLSNAPKSAIIRISGIFGNSLINKRDLIGDMLNKFYEKKEFSLRDDVFFNPIHSIDLAAIVEKIIRRRKTGIWHAGTRELITPYGLAKKVAEVYEIEYENLLSPINVSGKPKEKYGLVTLKTETDLGNSTPGIENSIIAYKSLYDGWKPIKLIY